MHLAYISPISPQERAYLRARLYLPIHLAYISPISRQERAYLHAAALRLPASTALVSADDLDAISAGEIATSAGTDGHA